MGDTVNVAARLMGAAKQGGAARALIDESTMAFTSDTVKYRALPPMALKGKTGMRHTFDPIALVETAKSGGSVGKMGRDQEFAKLRAYVAELLTYQCGGTIALLGPQGSGKTVLSKALEAHGRQARMQVLVGRMPPSSETSRLSSSSESVAAPFNMHRRGRHLHILSSGGVCSDALNSSSMGVVSMGVIFAQRARSNVTLDPSGTPPCVPAEPTASCAITETLSELSSLHNKSTQPDTSSALLASAAEVEHALRLPAFCAWLTIVDNVIRLGAAADSVSATDFVREALRADQLAVQQPQEQRRQNGAACAATEPAFNLDQVTLSLPLIETRQRGLLGSAWLLNILLADAGTDAGSEEELALHFDSPFDIDPHMQVGWPLLAMILAIFTHYSNGGHRRTLVIPHLIGENENDIESCVDLWSWRLAAAMSDLLRVGALPRLVMCAVTRRLTLITDNRSATEEAHKAEMEHAFRTIMDAAQDTATFMNLAPLEPEGRARYLFELLRAHHGYLGDREGVPDTLVEAISQRAAGHPKFIEELLREMIKTKAVVVEQSSTGSRVRSASMGVLQAVQLPPTAQATLMQVFDCLPAPLQSVLKRVAPLACFSEGVLASLGLPAAIMERVSSLLARAVSEGLLQTVYVIPAELKSMDPSAALAWRWCHPLMRYQIESMVLASDREATCKAIAELTEHHHQVAKRVERARTAFRTMRASPSPFSRMSSHYEDDAALGVDELRKHLAAMRQRCERAERQLKELQGAPSSGDGRLASIGRLVKGMASLRRRPSRSAVFPDSGASERDGS